MTWYYRVVKRKDGHYAICEYFKNYGWTEEDMAPYGESKQEVIQVLEMMLEDAKRHPTLIESRHKTH